VTTLLQLDGLVERLASEGELLESNTPRSGVTGL
jgi:hypothetical protein